MSTPASTTQAETFGGYFDSKSRLNRVLSVPAATDPLVGEIVADDLAIPRANVPLRLYGGVYS